MEKERKQLINKMLFCKTILVIGLFIIISTFAATHYLSIQKYIFLGFKPTLSIGIVIAVIAGILRNQLDGKYEYFIRKPAVEEILNHLNINWQAYSNNLLEKKAFNDIMLFHSYPCYLSSYFLMTGNYENKTFGAAQINAKTQSGKNTIFSGLMIQINDKYNSDETTVILQDVAQNTLGKSLGKKLQNKVGYKNLNLVYFDDDRIFEKVYVIYTSNKIHARNILTKNKRDQLLVLNQLYPNRVSISFQSDKTTIAIQKLNLFKYALSDNLIDGFLVERVERDVNALAKILDCFL